MTIAIVASAVLILGGLAAAARPVRQPVPVRIRNRR